MGARPLEAVLLYGGPAVAAWCATQGLKRWDYAAVKPEIRDAYQDCFHAAFPSRYPGHPRTCFRVGFPPHRTTATVRPVLQQRRDARRARRFQHETGMLVRPPQLLV